MLHLLSQPSSSRRAAGIGKVLEFAGDGTWRDAPRRARDAHQHGVEAGGFTGIIEADEVVVDYLVEARHSTRTPCARDREGRSRARVLPPSTSTSGARADGGDARRPAQRRGPAPASPGPT
jgi:homoaconitase/3-isopropylmalate dehydratase large subunit